MLERWNPTVKAFTVLVCVILLSFEYLVSLNLLVLAVCLLLLVFCSRVSLKKIGVILFPACVAAFGLFVMGLYYARGGSTQTVDMSSLSAMPYSVRAAMSQNLYTALRWRPVCWPMRGWASCSRFPPRAISLLRACSTSAASRLSLPMASWRRST